VLQHTIFDAMNFKRSNLSLALSLILLIAGCASNGARVPSNAILVTERSAGLAFAATEKGTVYISNKSSGKLIFYPETKRVILNGTVVKEDSSFDPKQVHRLYFLKG
jgi:hypothetical protein